jgi:hypothetical protein
LLRSPETPILGSDAEAPLSKVSSPSTSTAPIAILGSDAEAPLSSRSNSSRRLALYVRIVRPLRSPVSSASRALSAPRLVNVSLRMRARSHRSAICTPTSTFALRGDLGRAGMMVVA